MHASGGIEEEKPPNPDFVKGEGANRTSVGRDCKMSKQIKEGEICTEKRGVGWARPVQERRWVGVGRDVWPVERVGDERLPACCGKKWW